MISIIICSINNAQLNQVKTSIDETIGCAYELIVIDNRVNVHSIFSAYNEGASKAKFRTLCFVHEDIEFYSKNWGPAIVEIFNTNESVGLIGACGSKLKTELPTSWIDVPSNLYVSGLIKEPLCEIKDIENSSSEVVVIDGLFMATTKSEWKKIDFPNWKGFHGYDLLLSLLIGQYKRILVLESILILHKSSGSFSSAWFDVTLKIHNTFHKLLPRSLIQDKQIQSKAYAKNSLKFIQRTNNVSDSFKRIRLIYKYLLLNKNIKLKYKLKALYSWTKN